MKKYFRAIIAYISLTTGIFSTIAQIPTVFDRENTADSYLTLTFKEFEEIPEIPTLPDTFTFADGTRSTEFTDWERHRSEILQMLWHYELGQKPTVCKDSVDAVLDNDTLRVTVHENGKTLTLNSHIVYPKGDGPFPRCNWSRISDRFTSKRTVPRQWRSSHRIQFYGSNVSYPKARGGTYQQALS